jgi:hypothetical protein
VSHADRVGRERLGKKVEARRINRRDSRRTPLTAGLRRRSSPRSS